MRGSHWRQKSCIATVWKLVPLPGDLCLGPRPTAFVSGLYAANLNLGLVPAVRKALRATSRKMKTISSSPAKVCLFQPGGIATGSSLVACLFCLFCFMGRPEASRNMSRKRHPNGTLEQQRARLPAKVSSSVWTSVCRHTLRQRLPLRDAA